MKEFSKMIANRLSLPVHYIENVLNLLGNGATIPFISRYRKEATGCMNEVQIEEIQNLYERLTELNKRKEAILSTIEAQGKLTDELKTRIESCWNSTELEDIYLPYRPKRQTRAESARQKGLEPLAALLMAQREYNLMKRVSEFVKGDVANAEEALKGAKDIIAEQLSEDEQCRNIVRNAFSRQAVISSKVIKGKETEEGALKYHDYFNFSEPLKRCSSHRLLAIRRGEKEGYLRVSIAPSDESFCIERLRHRYIRSTGLCSDHVSDAINDAYKRLLKPAIETEFAASSKAKADEEAIRVFTNNLKQLLLAPPLGQRKVLAIDPGFRTGCKIVCLDEQGNLKHTETIYPHPPRSEYKQAGNKLVKLVEQYRIEAIAIGNGTAGRETEKLVSSLRYNRELQIFVVSEDGASIYSASKIARDEFPDYDVTVRGAVSIGRCLMDPLAELVKIEAKSIGVGQYQHDVDQTKLKASLDRTVESCVNSVGVNINTASRHLLTYVSGLGATLAQNIIDYRTEHGQFRSRKELMNVPRMGSKTFEQCAGFLRIPSSDNPLDNSSVHPERYSLVERMAKDLNCSVKDLIKQKDLRSKIKIENYTDENVGLPTLNDILKELDKPGRDPRQQIEYFEFSKDIHSIDDLQEGMELPGIITNITNFGCFVDIGIKENGLVHISEITDKYIDNLSDIIKIHQHVHVKILSVDKTRKRIQLSMKGLSSH